MILEVCVADPQSLAAAIEGGADRIELCSALELGGLTPSMGLMQLATEEAQCPVYALIRPRPGDFVFDFDDYGAMLYDIEAVRSAGLDGVVLGCSRANGEIDDRMLSRLCGQADGLGLTMHRAFDLAPDLADAIEIAVDLGFERILTSGGAPAALDGLERLALAHATANGSVAIMAGSGLTPDNVGELVSRNIADEIHSSCAVAKASPAPVVRLGFAAPSRRVTDASVVKAMKAALATA
jgi:copper homeostasis protein